jgi:hypothetical protein
MQANDSLEILAQRVEQGDARAKAQLREQLQKQMTRITRRALGPSPSASELGRKIQATALRLDPQSQASSHLAHQVAANLCQTVVNRLWTGSTEGRLQTMTS